MWMSVHIHHEANFSTMSWCHLSHWFANYVSGVLHSPFQVLFSLSHLGLASFLGRWNWRGTSWSTGRLGGRGATGRCNSTEHLGYSLVMSGILWHFILILWCIYIYNNVYIYIYTHGIYHGISWYFVVYTSSTAQGGGGSFKNRKPIGEVVCCESGMAERSHWWTERCLRSPLFISLYLFFSLFLYLSLITYLPTYWSICLPIYLSVCLSISLSIYLSIYLAV